MSDIYLILFFITFIFIKIFFVAILPAMKAKKVEMKSNHLKNNYMLSENIINNLLNEEINFSDLPNDGIFYVIARQKSKIKQYKQEKNIEKIKLVNKNMPCESDMIAYALEKDYILIVDNLNLCKEAQNKNCKVYYLDSSAKKGGKANVI